MSVFNIKLEYPEINPKYYKTNSDGRTPKCPANWDINELSEFGRYVVLGDEYYLQLDYGETIETPFLTNNISNLTNKTLTFKHFVSGATTENYTILVFFNDTDFKVLSFAESNVEYTRTFEVPSNAEYIKFLGVEDFTLWLAVDFDYNFSTGDYQINTEQNDVSIAPNIVSNVTLSNKVVSRKLSKTDVTYTSKPILIREDELSIAAVCDLARLNKILLSVNINIVEEAGNSLSNLPSGGDENWVKYYCESHKRTEKTGIYRYLDLRYRKDVNSNAIYF